MTLLKQCTFEITCSYTHKKHLTKGIKLRPVHTVRLRSNTGTHLYSVPLSRRKSTKFESGAASDHDVLKDVHYRNQFLAKMNEVRHYDNFLFSYVNVMGVLGIFGFRGEGGGGERGGGVGAAKKLRIVCPKALSKREMFGNKTPSNTVW